MPQQAGEADGQPAAPPWTASAYAQPLSADLRQCPHMALAEHWRTRPGARHPKYCPSLLRRSWRSTPAPLFLELFIPAPGREAFASDSNQFESGLKLTPGH
ncbi:MAG: hypothetical protein KBE53_10265 [Chromatiaceae bacterium]|nr:hypothetical protein [Chromatiaceae bacterium]